MTSCMKRALIGGFLSLIGSIWSLAVAFIARSNLVGSWSSPPGRLITTIIEMKLLIVFIPAVASVIAGLGIMLVELFRKDR